MRYDRLKSKDRPWKTFLNKCVQDANAAFGRILPWLLGTIECCKFQPHYNLRES